MASSAITLLTPKAHYNENNDTISTIVLYWAETPKKRY